MITSNHKKLVNACYPTNLKQNTCLNVSPDPNSLSKLIYYCSTRPNKIQKITCYLISYAQSQALPASFTSSFSVYRHSKPGLICTIKIFKALLENCSCHLTLLAPQLNAVIAIGLGLINQSSPSLITSSASLSTNKGYFGTDWVSQDLDITLAAVDLFSQYAQSVQFDCLQDRQLARNFLFFLAKFSSIAMVCPSTATLIKSINSLNQPPLKPKSARCMALMALESTIQGPDMYSSTVFDRQIRMIIPGLMATITPSPLRDPDELLILINQTHREYPSSSVSFTASSLTQEIKHLRSIISPTTNPEKSKPTESDLINYSIKTLNFLISVQLIHLNQFEICINTILNQLEFTMTSEQVSTFYDWFGRSLLSWAMPKHRPIAIDLVVHRLTSIVLKNQSEHEIPEKPSPALSRLSSEQQQKLKVKNLMIFASMLKAMLTDPVAGSIQLLNTLNILQQILRLIQTIIEESHTLEQEDLDRSRDLLIEVIGSLVHKVYYDEQINDICKDLLGRISSIVTQKSLSLQDSPATHSFEPSFVVALFDCLDRILINSSTDLNSHHATPESTVISTRTQPEHRPVSILLWKENLSILDDLRGEPECRSGFYKALISFLKFDAFSDHQLSNPDRVQQLIQFLSTFNNLFYHSFIGSQTQSVHNGTNISTSTETYTPTAAVDEMLPRNSVQTVVGESDHDDHQHSSPAFESKFILSESVDLAGLKACLMEIFAHQYHSSLLVCFPMLRELDRIMTTMSTQSKMETAEYFAADKSSSVSLSTIINEKRGFIIDCLEKIGQVWKIEKLDQKDVIIKTYQALNGEYEEQKNVLMRELQWDVLTEEVCNCQALQEKSGMDNVNLKLHFEQRWVVESTKSSGVVRRNSHDVTRRGSIRSYSSTFNQVPIKDLADRRSSPDLRGQGQRSSGSLRRKISTTPAFTKSHLPNLLNGGSNFSNGTNRLSNANGFLLSTTASSATSVSDLRKSLLGIGFLPMVERNTSSGHSSMYRNPNTTTTNTSHIINQRNSSSSGNLFTNNSAGDLAQFASYKYRASMGTSILANRSLKRFNEFGAQPQLEENCDSPNGLSPMNTSFIDSQPTQNHNRNAANTITTTSTTPTTCTTIDEDFLIRRRLTLDKRKTLTTQILDEVRKASLHQSSRHHHVQPFQLPPPSFHHHIDSVNQVDFSDKRLPGAKGLGVSSELDNHIDNRDKASSDLHSHTPTHILLNHHLISQSPDFLFQQNSHLSSANNFIINPPYNK